MNVPSKLYFWGKIRGTVKDYFVCYYVSESTTQDLVPAKHFYWCSSQNYIFSSLSKPTQNTITKLRAFPMLFTGEFDQVIVQSHEPPKVIDAAAGIILPPKHLTELDRLSVVVN